MHVRQFFAFFILLLIVSFRPGSWIVERDEKYTIYMDSADFPLKNIYMGMFDKGITITEKFMGKSFPKTFPIYIHPTRLSIDQQWQRDWSAPEFKSECWMVAGGTGMRLDIIAPGRWDELSCEHKFSDTLQTQQLITHELVHVFHGMINPDSVFSNVKNLDWLVEGLAVYASGQCDKIRLYKVRRQVREDKAPMHLSEFWTGENKYGLSGSLVLYIDKHYGRKKLLSLLSMGTDKEVLTALKTTEEGLIRSWKAWMKS